MLGSSRMKALKELEGEYLNKLNLTISDLNGKTFFLERSGVLVGLTATKIPSIGHFIGNMKYVYSSGDDDYLEYFSIYELANNVEAEIFGREMSTKSLEKAEVIPDSAIDYKFDEGKIIEDVKAYIDGTYTKHYAAGKFQATDAIIDTGHGLGFCVGNILKYAWRLGKKDGFNQDDVMKVIHYSIILLHIIRNGAKKNG